MTAGFIAGDWGTSRLRLFLCAADGTVLQRREGPGIAAAGAQAGETLRPMIRSPASVWSR